jgi:hypothetical protein
MIPAAFEITLEETFGGSGSGSVFTGGGTPVKMRSRVSFLPAYSRDKHTAIFCCVSWAHFRHEAPETGLSAPIPHLSRR